MGRHGKPDASGADREQRLKQALKANLKRRKAQAQSRAADSTDPEDGAGDVRSETGGREAEQDG